MKMIKTLTIVAALSAASMPTRAGNDETSQSIRERAPKGITEAFYTCLKNSGSDPVSIGDCTSTEKKVQDTRLNRAYSILMKKLDKRSAESMKVSERAWIDFNGKAVNAELDLREKDKTVNIEAALSELFRYCDRANQLEVFVYYVQD